MYKKIVLCSLFLLSTPMAFAISTYELERIIQAQSQLLSQYQQNIIGLQNEVDVLRGQVQETSYRLEETIKRQKMMLKQMNGEDGTRSAKGTQPAEDEWQASGNEKEDYQGIVNRILKEKDRDSSIEAMQQFIKTYPGSSYLSNAYYWLGQLNYQQKRKAEASYYFANVVKKYPKSSKAAESMYKVGLILKEEGKEDKAHTIFEQVMSKYPNDLKIIEKVNMQLGITH